MQLTIEQTLIVSTTIEVPDDFQPNTCANRNLLLNAAHDALNALGSLNEHESVRWLDLNVYKPGKQDPIFYHSDC